MKSFIPKQSSEKAQAFRSRRNLTLMKQLIWEASSVRPQGTMHSLGAMIQEYLEIDITFLPWTSAAVSQPQLPGIRMIPVLEADM